MIHPDGPKRVTANTHMAKTDGCKKKKKKVHERININSFSIDSGTELNNSMKYLKLVLSAVAG